MGCGEGNLTRLLIREKQLQRVAATDVSFTALERARDKLKIDRLHETLQEKLELFQSSLIYRDKRFEGFDCACVIEVVDMAKKLADRLMRSRIRILQDYGFFGLLLMLYVCHC